MNNYRTMLIKRWFSVGLEIKNDIKPQEIGRKLNGRFMHIPCWFSFLQCPGEKNHKS